MKILQSVIVKQILTEKTKARLTEKYKHEIMQLDKEHEQLLFEEKKQLRNYVLQETKIKSYYKNERNKRMKKKTAIEFQLEQIHILPLGSEIEEREATAIVEIKEGDSWEDQTALKTIVIKDGIVHEIH
ncbi:YlqD family protein [Niallia nealsonii]|uniref:YlqD protein n=1 Tax=Niallia nealsonii TaxID=115979 RepID=A0A2N0Z6R0_9BACI|nr:YlqD family protein [Niallia nealsonii]PKG25192.1 hypothetical protein CWS01_02720 [Niallia nealsonii]